jgi:Haloacid Dehalogenase superfamily, subfamily IB, phosphoserine phosphatase-like
MEYKVYDFDKTLYDGDSSIDLYKFLVRKKPILLFYIPKFITGFLKYYIKIYNKKELKENYFSFLKNVRNIDLLISEFWIVNQNKIKDFYKIKDHTYDIIISASPDFLLRPILAQYNIHGLIASEVDKKTGKFISENCYGEEKVNRLNKLYNDIIIDEFYTDSKSDLPLALISHNSYLVKGNKIIRWNLQEP